MGTVANFSFMSQKLRLKPRSPLSRNVYVSIQISMSAYTRTGRTMQGTLNQSVHSIDRKKRKSHVRYANRAIIVKATRPWAFHEEGRPFMNALMKGRPSALMNREAVDTTCFGPELVKQQLFNGDKLHQRLTMVFVYLEKRPFASSFTT
jgi:hypothetical protein